MAFRASIMICFWKTNASVSDIYPYRRKPSLEQAISLMHAYTHSVHTEHNKRMHYRFPQKHLATLLSMSAFPPFRYNGNHRKETERKHAEKVIWKKKHEVHLCISQILQTEHKGEFLWIHVKAVKITFHNV